MDERKYNMNFKAISILGNDFVRNMAYNLSQPNLQYNINRIGD